MNQACEGQKVGMAEQREIDGFMSLMHNSLDQLSKEKHRLYDLSGRVAGPEPKAPDEANGPSTGPQCLMDELHIIQRRFASDLDDIHGELNRIEKFI